MRSAMSNGEKPVICRTKINRIAISTLVLLAGGLGTGCESSLHAHVLRVSPTDASWFVLSKDCFVRWCMSYHSHFATYDGTAATIGEHGIHGPSWAHVDSWILLPRVDQTFCFLDTPSTEGNVLSLKHGGTLVPMRSLSPIQLSSSVAADGIQIATGTLSETTNHGKKRPLMAGRLAGGDDNGATLSGLTFEEIAVGGRTAVVPEPLGLSVWAFMLVGLMVAGLALWSSSASNSLVLMTNSWGNVTVIEWSISTAPPTEGRRRKGRKPWSAETRRQILDVIGANSTKSNPFDDD